MSPLHHVTEMYRPHVSASSEHLRVTSIDSTTCVDIPVTLEWNAEVNGEVVKNKQRPLTLSVFYLRVT
jgi:hypothetical protein